jgi:hypothetical protein
VRVRFRLRVVARVRLWKVRPGLGFSGFQPASLRGRVRSVKLRRPTGGSDRTGDVTLVGELGLGAKDRAPRFRLVVGWLIGWLVCWLVGWLRLVAVS